MKSTGRWLAALALLVHALGASGAHAQSCAVPLLKFGPISPVHGFPLYCQDSTLLGLQPCLDAVCDPAFALPNPNKPVSFPDNFPDELFYQRAIANMTGPNGQTFLLNLALEGSFLNAPTVANGDQVLFTRVRVRATNLVPGATYKVTHPFGVESLQASDAAAAVPGVINFTRDSARIPASAGVALAFSPALTADVGPFLRFATGASPPTQAPAEQASPVVHALPSVQEVPSGLEGFEQMPLAGSQVPAKWHWSWAVQTTALVPTQTPP